MPAMNEKPPERPEYRLCRQCLSFYGSITASLSHELKNTLAIINEYNGLLGDHLADSAGQISVDNDKLGRAVNRIGAQIERGDELIRRLNRFAHSADFETGEVELNNLIQEIVNLSQRLAGLKMIQMDYAFSAQKIALNTNPFFLQYALFLCFELFWDNAEKNRRVAVASEKTADGVRIIISGSALAKTRDSAGKREILGLLLTELRATIEVIVDGPGNESIVLTIKT